MIASILIKLDSIMTAVIYLIACFILFFIGKKVYEVFHKGINMDHELVEKDNLAFSMANVGYFIGLLLSIYSTMIGEGWDNLWYNLMDIALYGLLAIMLLNISIIINDKVMFKGFNMKKEIVDDQNVGTGVIEGANSVATGLIIFGVMADNQDHFFDIILLWLLAQVSLMLVGWVYNLITPYNIHEHIEKDNVAVGVGYAGAVIAIANLIRFGIGMESNSWIETVEYLGLETGIGLLLLPVARFMTDKLLLPKRKLTDEIINQEHPNIGAAIIEAFSYIGGSVLIIASFS